MGCTAAPLAWCNLGELCKPNKAMGGRGGQAGWYGWLYPLGRATVCAAAAAMVCRPELVARVPGASCKCFEIVSCGRAAHTPMALGNSHGQASRRRRRKPGLASVGSAQRAPAARRDRFCPAGAAAINLGGAERRATRVPHALAPGAPHVLQVVQRPGHSSLPGGLASRPGPHQLQPRCSTPRAQPTNLPA